jgi:hypothetical protein
MQAVTYTDTQSEGNACINQRIRNHEHRLTHNSLRAYKYVSYDTAGSVCACSRTHARTGAEAGINADAARTRFDIYMQMVACMHAHATHASTIACTTISYHAHKNPSAHAHTHARNHVLQSVTCGLSRRLHMYASMFQSSYAYASSYICTICVCAFEHSSH